MLKQLRSVLILLCMASISHAGPDSTAYYYNKHEIISSQSRGVQFFRYTLGDITTAELVRQFPANSVAEKPSSLEWSQDLSTLYGITLPGYRLITVDVSTGDITTIGTLSGLRENDLPGGLAIDAQGNCYVSASGTEDFTSALYRCDLSTGELELIGTTSVAQRLLEIVATCDGRLFGVEIVNDSLYELNPQDGSATLIGPLGFDIAYSQSMTLDRETGDIYAYLEDISVTSRYVRIDRETGAATLLAEPFQFQHHVGAAATSCDMKTLHAGYNGAWFNPETPGQGVLLDVLPDTGQLFLAWFTYDVDPVMNTSAVIGDPGHRWFTAQGTLSNSGTQSLTLFNTSGGIFDSGDSVTTVAIGSMTLTFDDCGNGRIEYVLDESGQTGSFPIQRIANDNVALCESMNAD